MANRGGAAAAEWMLLCATHPQRAVLGLQETFVVMYRMPRAHRVESRPILSPVSRANSRAVATEGFCMSWRDQAQPIIREVIRNHPEVLDPRTPRPIRLRFFREAYPFGIRKYWPYKIWLDEIARQLGRKPPLRMRDRGWAERHAEEIRKLHEWERLYGKCYEVEIGN